MNYRFDYLETVNDICFETIVIDKGVDIFPEEYLCSALESCIIDTINENSIILGCSLKYKDRVLFKIFDFYADNRDKMEDELSYTMAFCDAFLYSYRKRSPRHSTEIGDHMVDIIEELNQEIFSKLAGHVSIKESNSDTNFHTFATGAVRDIQKGKGRVDLVPLDTVSNFFTGCPIDTIKMTSEYRELVHIESFKNTDDIRYLYKALYEFCRDLNCDPTTLILDVSSHFEACLEKYEKDNWKKGIPVYSFINRGTRHYLKWLRGDVDERHDLAFIWNILCCIATIEHGYCDEE